MTQEGLAMKLNGPHGHRSPSGLAMMGVTTNGPPMTPRDPAMRTSGPQMSPSGPQMSLSGQAMTEMITNGPQMMGQAPLPGLPMTAGMKHPLGPGRTQQADQV